MALRPIGLIPYDGHTLPLITPSGSHLATQQGIAGASAAGEDVLIEIFNLNRSPLTSIRSSGDDPVVLAYTADDEGIYVYRMVGERERTHAKCLLDGTVIDAEHPKPDQRIVDRIVNARRGSAADALASISMSADGSVLFFDPGAGRMSVWMAGDVSPIPLAANSIAGCWASGASGPAVLITTNEGLFLQRLSSDRAGWRAADPTRLLREPFVPRATSNPDRPFLLIGPGPKDKPELLQIIAMQLIED